MDTGYKLLFSNPRLVQDLLEGFIRPDWLAEIDFETLEPVKASFATDDLRQRHDDSIWRVRLRGERWLYLYLLLEFQARDDHYMACRIMTYLVSDNKCNFLRRTTSCYSSAFSQPKEIAR